jgi:hypothetical protein
MSALPTTADMGARTSNVMERRTRGHWKQYGYFLERRKRAIRWRTVRHSTFRISGSIRSRGSNWTQAREERFNASESSDQLWRPISPCEMNSLLQLPCDLQDSFSVSDVAGLSGRTESAAPTVLSAENEKLEIARPSP